MVVCIERVMNARRCLLLIQVNYYGINCIQEYEVQEQVKT